MVLSLGGEADAEGADRNPTLAVRLAAITGPNLDTAPGIATHMGQDPPPRERETGLWAAFRLEPCRRRRDGFVDVGSTHDHQYPTSAATTSGKRPSTTRAFATVPSDRPRLARR